MVKTLGFRHSVVIVDFIHGSIQCQSDRVLIVIELFAHDVTGLVSQVVTQFSLPSPLLPSPPVAAADLMIN
jgi:hypothetical protein